MRIFALVLTALAGYLLGNLNGAVIISSRLFQEDVRTKGSGNAGATNFIRNYGTGKAIFVLLIDVGKTVLGCYFGALMLRWMGFGELWTTGKMLGGVAVILGHMFPVFLHFRGGKGVLCGATLTLVMNPLMFLVFFAIFLVLFVTTHYVSLCSIVSACCYPLLYGLFFPGQWEIFAMALGIGALCVIMHHANIKRLLQKTESKTYLKEH